MTPTHRPLTPPIVVIGSARSGTSLTAGLLAAQGVWTGPCRQATRKNPRGFFENHGLYKHRGEQPADPADVARTLAQQGYAGGPWLVKQGVGGHSGWLSLAPLFVCVRRDLEPMLASQMKWQPPGKTEDQRRGIIAKQQRELDRVRDELGGVDFWPQEVVAGRYMAFVTLCHSLGLDSPKLDTVQAFVDPTIWDREANG